MKINKRLSIKTLGKLVATLLALIAIAITALALMLLVQSSPDRDTVPEYVAMGSSFAAGPGIDDNAGGPFLCSRSNNNYAHVLAEAKGLSLVDVSCSGASTKHILSDRQWFQAPQITAIDERTRLVTITIGGNDVGYIGRVMACRENASWLMRQAASCESELPETMAKKFSALEEKLVVIGSEVKRRAPAAKVVFVAYPTVLPAEGTCAKLGLSEQQASELRQRASRLLNVTKNAAKRSAAAFFDSASLSDEHNVCTDASWIFPAPIDGGKMSGAFHPNADSMRAVANALQQMLVE